MAAVAFATRMFNGAAPVPLFPAVSGLTDASNTLAVRDQLALWWVRGSSMP